MASGNRRILCHPARRGLRSSGGSRRPGRPGEASRPGRARPRPRCRPGGRPSRSRAPRPPSSASAAAGTRRTSPRSPISPKTDGVPREAACPRAEEASAATTARSAAGSAISSPPVQETKTSREESGRPAPSRTASSSASRAPSRPIATRRGEPDDGRTDRGPGSRRGASASPRGPPSRQLPGQARPPLREQRGRRRWRSRPAPRPSCRRARARPPARTGSSWRGAMRRRELRSPSIETTASTRCSSDLGPARLPSFVTWPMSRTGTPLAWRSAGARAPHSRTCDTVPAAEESAESRTAWIESTTRRAGAPALGQRRRCERRPSPPATESRGSRIASRSPRSRTWPADSSPVA